MYSFYKDDTLYNFLSEVLKVLKEGMVAYLPSKTVMAEESSPYGTGVSFAK